MAVAMLSAAGFSAAKLMNQSNLSDQMLENIEAISFEVELSNGSKGDCAPSKTNICVRDLVDVYGIFSPK